MTIHKVEKQSMSQNNLPKLLGILLFFCSWFVMSQEQEPPSRKLKKVGFLYNNAQNKNFLFNDEDYRYQIHVFKAQLFYNLIEWEKWDFNLLIQPQVQMGQHQLLNPFFIQPEDGNVDELRERFTQERTLSLLAFELGFQFRREVFNGLFFEANFGLGVAYIDKDTERLAQGFTFIENISLGFAHPFKSSEIYIGGQIGHVSNFDIQLPNSGYDTLGFEIGYRILLE